MPTSITTANALSTPRPTMRKGWPWGMACSWWQGSIWSSWFWRQQVLKSNDSQITQAGTDLKSSKIGSHWIHSDLKVGCALTLAAQLMNPSWWGAAGAPSKPEKVSTSGAHVASEGRAAPAVPSGWGHHAVKRYQNQVMYPLTIVWPSMVKIYSQLILRKIMDNLIYKSLSDYNDIPENW